MNPTLVPTISFVVSIKNYPNIGYNNVITTIEVKGVVCSNISWSLVYFEYVFKKLFNWMKARQHFRRDLITLLCSIELNLHPLCWIDYKFTRQRLLIEYYFLWTKSTHLRVKILTTKSLKNATEIMYLSLL